MQDQQSRSVSLTFDAVEFVWKGLPQKKYDNFMKMLVVHVKRIDALGGAELNLRGLMAAAPGHVSVDVIRPDDPVDVHSYDTIVLANLRPEGGPGEQEECRAAREWIRRLRGYRGHLIRLEHDVHPCTYRDGRCIDFSAESRPRCRCRSPIRHTFEALFNICDTVLFLSPLHRRAINTMIRIRGPRQAEIASPVDLNFFRKVVPFEERRHAALITGDAVRVAPDAEELASAAGYPVEYMDYLSVPYEQMPDILNRYQAVVVAPRMLHAFGRLAVEALACGCRVITNERVGAMSYDDPVGAAKESAGRFWEMVLDRPARPNIRRLFPGAGMDVQMPVRAVRAGVRLLRTCIGSWARLCRVEAFPVHQERLIYHCPLNARKRVNLACQAVNKRFLKAVEISRPHILHVGVTTRCNLHCPACPTGTASLGRAGEDLDYGLFCRTVDSLRGSLLFMLFWDWGEPFLHPQLADMIEYAGRSGIRTVISTNGNVVYSPARLEELVRAKPTTVIVCVDGADQETYATYRAGGRLDTVLKTIRNLADTRDRLGLSTPMIEFRTLATKGTEAQMPELLALALDSGADLFSVKTLRPFDYRSANVDDALVPDDEALSRYRYKENQRTAASREGLISQGELTCGKPLYAPTLNSDGTLAFCSYARQAEELFGNLAEQSFSRVWKNRASRHRRREFLRSCGTPSCRTCYFRSKPVPTILHQVPLRPLPEGLELEIPESPESFLSRF